MYLYSEVSEDIELKAIIKVLNVIKYLHSHIHVYNRYILTDTD